MKSFIYRLVESKCTGIYIGHDAALAVTSSRKLRTRDIDSITAVVNAENAENITGTTTNIEVLKNNLNELLNRHVALGVVQIAFDDLYVRFFVLPLSEKPEKRELENILRWQAEKVLQNPGDYDYTAQLIETPVGFHIYGSAIRTDIMNAVGDVLRSHNLAWYMADSASSYIWNSVEDKLGRHAIAYLILGKHGWTLIACDTSGIVEMIKPGRWALDADRSPKIRSGMIEANRLLTTFVDKHPESTPDRVYMDIGAMPEAFALAKEFFGDRLTLVQPQNIPVESLRNVPASYIQEFNIAMKASFSR